ncbi:hypothetical protein ACVWZV_004537 [Bradyrhizobium sp. GM5.1]
MSKWLRLCNDAFLQAGHPGDDYPIRMQVFVAVVSELKPGGLHSCREMCPTYDRSLMLTARTDEANSKELDFPT